MVTIKLFSQLYKEVLIKIYECNRQNILPMLANKATPQQALDYYLGWTLNPAQKEKFIPLQAKDFAFMKDWGMQMQVEDARAVKIVTDA